MTVIREEREGSNGRTGNGKTKEWNNGRWAARATTQQDNTEQIVRTTDKAAVRHWEQRRPHQQLDGNKRLAVGKTPRGLSGGRRTEDRGSALVTNQTATSSHRTEPFCGQGKSQPQTQNTTNDSCYTSAAAATVVLALSPALEGFLAAAAETPAIMERLSCSLLCLRLAQYCRLARR